jgi:hypothetical protein
MRTAILTVLLTVFPLWANAGWKNCPGNLADTSTTVERLTPGITSCYLFSTATSPPRADGRLCRGVDVFVDADIAQAAGAGFVQGIHVYRCPDVGSGFATCEKTLIDRNGDGIPDDQSMTGISPRDAIYSMAPTILAFEVLDAPPSGGGESGVGMIMLACRRP